MSRSHAQERAYQERQHGTSHQDPTFDGKRWGNQRKMRADMKVKLRREERHRERDAWLEEAPPMHALHPNPNRTHWIN